MKCQPDSIFLRVVVVFIGLFDVALMSPCRIIDIHTLTGDLSDISVLSNRSMKLVKDTFFLDKE